MMFLMPTCREMALGLSTGSFEHVAWYKRLMVRMHLSMCEHCNRFARQLSLISQALRNMWQVKPNLNTLDAIKRRILSHIKQN